MAEAIRLLAGHEETSWGGAGRRPLGPCGGVFHQHHRALRFWAARSDRHARWLAQCVLGAWARGKCPGDLNAGLELADALVLRRRATRSAVLAQVPELVWQVLAQTQQLLVPAPRAPMATDSVVGVAALYLRAFSMALCTWAVRYSLRNPVAMAGPPAAPDGAARPQPGPGGRGCRANALGLRTPPAPRSVPGPRVSWPRWPGRRRAWTASSEQLARASTRPSVAN